jgi:hypothetical protein
MVKINELLEKDKGREGREEFADSKPRKGTGKGNL